VVPSHVSFTETDGMSTTPGSQRYAPIGDYAIVGDCRSAALVRRDGSIDWLCVPRFDSPSVFAALLDADRGGRFRVRPAAHAEIHRGYVQDTAVLQTRFVTATGTLRVVDAMCVTDAEAGRQRLRPEQELLRTIECTDGEVEVELCCDPRPDYGCIRPHLRERDALGFQYQHRDLSLWVRSDLPLGLREEGSELVARARLRQGDRRHVSLAVAHQNPAILAPLGDAAAERLAETIEWWRSWSTRCRYRGPHREAVMRSAITLKLMSYAPSGAVVAAPTTSLPEAVGGVRNWDYRFCWLRDASLTLQALFDLGYRREAEAFLSWLLHTTRTRRLDPRVVYDVFGERRLRERVLPYLEGYAESRPVRIGNGAAEQLQLDTYGELADAVFEFVRRGGRLDRQTGRLLVGLGEAVCRRWREPDDGIWESRGQRRHHVYSKAMCWVALDRLLRLHRDDHLRAPVERFESERAAVREAIESRGFNAELGSYTTAFDGDDVDASLLLLARYGYVESRSERMVSTVRHIRERLGQGALLHRYRARDDGLPAGEGAFGICSFWAAEAAARQGDVQTARSSFEALLGYANDVGLYAEEIDPRTGAALGNFPQAFTHVGLIDAALMLAQVMEQPPSPVERRVGRTEARV
jgi:GH15 family glucan-1,4-alpha-glucosidase